MDPCYRIELFGQLKLRVLGKTGEAAYLPPGRAGLTLAVIALASGRTVPRDELLAILWSEEDEEYARARLRRALHDVRAALQPLEGDGPCMLEVTRTSVRLRTEVCITDVMEFENSIKLARGVAAPERISLLHRTVELYNEGLLPGYYLGYIQAVQQRLETAHCSSLDELAKACVETGDLAGALDALQRLVALDNLSESLHCDLMRLYAQLGRTTAVVQQYQILERLLRDELGEKPAVTTVELVDQLRRQAAPRDLVAILTPGQHSETILPDPPARAIERNGDDARTLQSITTQESLERTLLPDRSADEAQTARSTGYNRNNMRRLAVCIAGAACLYLAWLMASRSLAHAGWANEAANRAGSTHATGSVEWVERYAPAPDERDSEPTAIAVDGARDIYVAGFVQTIKTDVDYLVLKYDRNGPLLWRTRYDGPGHDVDRARAIALDDDANVLVTGESDNGKGNGSTKLSGLDFATVKLDPNGNIQWVARFNTNGDGEDAPVKIGVDSSGCSYVAGRSWDHQLAPNKPAFKIATVKYDRYGHEMWRRFFGPDATLDYRATDMVVDRTAGQVYVAAITSEPCAKLGRRSLVLLAYSFDGDLKWKHNIEGWAHPVDAGGKARIALDGHGGVIFAGALVDPGKCGQEAVYVFRYAADGAQRDAYTVAGHDDQTPISLTCLTTSATGGIGLACRESAMPDCATVLASFSFDPAQNQFLRLAPTYVGVYTDDFVGASFDAGGNLVLSGSEHRLHKEISDISVPDYFTEKHLDGAQEVWRQNYQNAVAATLAVSPDGGDIVTGQGYGRETHDIVTLKYNP